MNRAWLVSWWPRLVAAGVVLVVLAPAAVASYLHAKHVVFRHDEAMAAWLPITTDGMLLAALVVIWARRATRDPAGRWVWLAFWLGGVVTVAANLAAVLPTSGLSLAVEAVVVAVWPPVTVAITLELAMLLAMAIRVRRVDDAALIGHVTLSRADDAAPTLAPALATTLALDTPAATTGELSVTADAETESGGGATSQVDTPDQTAPAPPDSEARLYSAVVDLMGEGHGRPTIYDRLKPKYPELTVNQVRALMDKRRGKVSASTNGNGSGHQ